MDEPAFIAEIRTELRRLHPSLGPLPLDHQAFAVANLEAAAAAYSTIEPAVPETIPHEQVRVLMLATPTGRIELLEPLSPNSPLTRFLARATSHRAPHHIAFRVDAMDAIFAFLEAAGTPLASKSVQQGAGGHRYFFLHPRAMNGTLVELVSNPSL